MDSTPPVEPVAFDPVERSIALDLVKRGLWVAPAAILIGALIQGVTGAISVALAIAVVLVNFLAAAWSVSWAAKRSPQLAGGVAMGGFIVRLGIILIALLLVRRTDAIDFAIFAITLLVAHMGLLTWESRYVSMSLGAPGLRPRPPVTHGES